MSISALTTAILLAGAPADAAAVPPEPIAAAVEVPPDAAPPVAAEPQLPAPPAESATPGETAAPDAAVAGLEQVDQGAIVVTARPRADPGDPAQVINTISFSAVQSVDKAFVGPVSLAYKHSVPEPVRGGLRHFLDNLQEPVVFLNYLLQLKPGKAAETLGRFAINSTIGVGGLIDVAKKKPFNLPRHPNGFAYTLGYYGVKSGPFLFLPIIGPTTIRDLVGRWVDLLVLPLSIGKPFDRPAYGATTLVFRSIDERAEADERIRKMRDGSSDPYRALRDDYMRNRQAEIDALRDKRSEPAPVVPEAAAPPAEVPSSHPFGTEVPATEQALAPPAE